MVVLAQAVGMDSRVLFNSTSEPHPVILSTWRKDVFEVQCSGVPWHSDPLHVSRVMAMLRRTIDASLGCFPCFVQHVADLNLEERVSAQCSRGRFVFFRGKRLLMTSFSSPSRSRVALGQCAWPGACHKERDGVAEFLVAFFWRDASR